MKVPDCCTVHDFYCLIGVILLLFPFKNVSIILRTRNLEQAPSGSTERCWMRCMTTLCVCVPLPSPPPAGISGKSQVLFALVFTTRYLDLLTSFISLYNTTMKVRHSHFAPPSNILLTLHLRPSRPPLLPAVSTQCHGLTGEKS